MPSNQDLHSALTKARQELQEAQSRVAALEAQLAARQPTPLNLRINPEVTLDDEGAGETLRSKTHFRALLEAIDAVEDYAIYLLDADGYVTSWNTGAERLKGYHADEIIGHHFSHFFTPSDQQRERPQQLLDLARVDGRSEDEGWRVRKDGSHFWANVVITAVWNTNGTLYGFAKIIRDLTSRKLAEDHIRKLHRTLGVLSDINQAIVRIRHLPALLEKACEIAVEKGTFLMAWIGLFNPNTGRLEPVKYAGTSNNDLDQLISILDTDPVISRLCAGERLICNNMQTDPMWLSWHEQVCHLGYRAMVVLPLLVAGELRGVFNLYTGETDFFDEQEMRLINELVVDISFAIKVAEQEERRRKAEADLRTSKEKYRSLIESSESSIAMFDEHGLLLYANQIAANALSLTQEEAVGKPMHDLFPAPVSQSQLTNIQQVIRTGQGIVHEALNFLSGEERWYRTSVQPVQDASGKITSALINAVDITRFKQAEADLRKERDTLEQKVAERTADLQAALVRVEAILNNSPDAILLVASDLTIQQTNSSFNILLGAERDAYLGQSLLALLHPDDASRLGDFAQLAAIQQNGRHVEVRAMRKDGATFDAEFTIGAIQGDGLVCNIRDISMRKAQDRQLRYHASIQESVGDAVIATDMAFRIQSWNRAAETIYGWPATEVIEKSADELLQTTYESAEERAYRVQDFLERGAWQGEVIQQHRDGSLRYIHASVNLFKDEQGQPSGVVSVNRDITERKRAETTLQTKLAEDRQFQLYLKALHEIIIELTGIDELDLFYKRAVELGRARLGFERLAMFLYDERDDSAVGTYGTNSQGQLVNESGIRFTPDSTSIFRRSFDRVERFYFMEGTTLYSDNIPVGFGWNAAAALWNGSRGLGWFVADNLLSHCPAPKPLLDIIGLYALSVGTLLAQKQTQLALKESEALYRLLAENISDLIVRSTRAGECLYVSPSVETLLGYTPEEFIGQQKVSLIHPDDQVIIGTAYTSALERQDLILPHQYRAKHKDGHYIWLETVGKPIFNEASREIYGVITSSRDITLRRQSEEALRTSEEKYRFLVETMRGGIVLFDAELRVTFVNDRLCELLGYTREQAIGQPFVHFVDAAVIPLVMAQHEHRLRGESSSYELLLRHKDGRQIPLLLSGSPLFDKQGNYNGSIVVTTDISLQKQAEETLRLALAKEKELGDLKTRFVSMASHEFRTPLATILALVETLHVYRKKLSEEQIEQRFDKIKSQVEHLKNIMEDVLMLSRMQARRVEFNPVRLDLNGLCRSILDEFQSQSAVEHRLEYTVSGGCDELLLDHKLMRQAISNLLSNAIKYSPKGTVVCLDLAYTDAAVTLKVSDEGIGIPQADLPHLFEPFHRAANVGTISGTGLGLVITREAVELHGGTIAVESQQGVGTTFLLRIPCTIATPATVDASSLA